MPTDILMHFWGSMSVNVSQCHSILNGTPPLLLFPQIRADIVF